MDHDDWYSPDYQDRKPSKWAYWGLALLALALIAISVAVALRSGR